MKQNFDRLLFEANKIVPPIYTMRYEDDDLNLYFVTETQVLDKKGKPVKKYTKQHTFCSGSKKGMCGFLEGMISLSAMIREFNGMVNAMRQRQKNPVKPD
ncbi:MAG: hypothetical protein H8D45_11015 [Bacteroidetes bacterium]|nr:hypothetical protein [Bacteroidota bacterium]